LRFFLTILFTFVLTAYSLDLLGQNIELDVKKQPLNKVLLDLSTRSGINISFDNELVSNYYITAHKNFSGFDEAISFLLKKIPLSYELSNNVYLIFSSPEKKVDARDSLFFSGTIFDHTTYEPLPYSFLCINDKYMYSDVRGCFSYSEDFTDSLKIAISYLGYGSIDTIIPSSSKLLKQEFFLQPSSTNIKEITVNKSPIMNQPIIGRETGKIKMNAQIAHYLPGIGDNSLFQFLTLMPGISQVSGNNSGISIWGGSSENIMIEFDGIRLFNTNHFYGNIGMINPLSIKDIEVFKGATSADFAETESGLIKITGKKGNRIMPSFTAEINNLTLNALFETPAGANNTLLFAMRGMYRNPQNTIFFKQNNNTVYIPDFKTTMSVPYNKVETDYIFGDAQLKFSGSSNDKNNYYINLYQSYDHSKFTPDTTVEDIPFANSLKQRWGNSGISVYYNQLWRENFSSDILAGLSSNFETYDNELILQSNQDQTISRTNSQTRNQLWDFSVKNINTINTRNNQQIKFGIGVDYFLIDQQFSNNDTLQSSSEGQNILPHLFIQNKFNLGNHFVADIGIKTTYSSTAKKIFFSPNLSLTALISNSFSAGINLGQSHQFVSKIPIVFSDFTNKSFFTLADDDKVPVSSSNQLSTSINFIRPNYQVSVEAYFKNFQNISEYVPDIIDSSKSKPENGKNGNIESGYYTGKGYSRGISIYNQIMLGKFTSWFSYSLNESMRKIPGLYGDRYINSLNNYKHEIKVATIYQLWKFNFSASYIFCSGRSQHGFDELTPPENKNLPVLKPYNRFDIGLNFKTTIRKIELETGCSMLNVLNSQNLNYFNLKPDMREIKSNDSNNLFFELNSLPRSFCLYLKIKL
jgi:hypothetical protein